MVLEKFYDQLTEALISVLLDEYQLKCYDYKEEFDCYGVLYIFKEHLKKVFYLYLWQFMLVSRISIKNSYFKPGC